MKRFNSLTKQFFNRTNSKFFPFNTTSSLLSHQTNFFSTEQKTPSSSSSEDFAGVIAYRHSDLKLDFANVQIGQELVIPYEVTVSDTWRDQWQSVFYQQDRLFTSINYVETMKDGLRNYRNKMIHDYIGIPMPFSLVLFLASSMSHVDEERMVLDLSFRNCVYKEPVHPGDTL